MRMKYDLEIIVNNTILILELWPVKKKPLFMCV